MRELKDLGVDVYFEEQQIHSLSSDGELMLSILASTNTTFSNLTNIMHKYPEVHINIKVNNKNDFATSNMIEDSIKEIKNNFESERTKKYVQEY